jgi:hypothetical protein
VFPEQLHEFFLFGSELIFGGFPHNYFCSFATQI